jgi:multidrug resistance efflux pump
VTFRATDSITVAPRGSGRLERLAVKVASQVEAGDTVAWLDRVGAQIQVSQLQAALVAAQARLATRRSGARSLFRQIGFVLSATSARAVE